MVRVYLPTEELRLSKNFTAFKKNEFKVAPDLALLLEFPIFSCAVQNRLFLLGGGGGPSKSGVPNGIILGRLDKQDGKAILRPLAFLDTHPFIVQDIAVHPKYPLQLVLALNEHISICELQRFEPNLTKDSDLDFDLPILEELYRFKADKGESLNMIVFDEQGDYLAAGGSDKIVRVYKYDFIEPPSHSSPTDPICELEGCKDQIEYIDFHENAKYVAACCDTVCIYVWNLSAPSTPIKFACKGYRRFRACVFDGEYILGLCQYGDRTYILKFSLDSPDKPVAYCNLGQSTCKTLRRSPCKRYLAILTLRPDYIFIYDLKSLKQIWRFKSEIDFPFVASFTENSDGIILVGANKEALLKEFPKPSKLSLYCFYFFLLLGVILVLLLIFCPQTMHAIPNWLEQNYLLPDGKDEL